MATIAKARPGAGSGGGPERDEHGQPSFTFTIDGQTVKAHEGQTVLSAAIAHGILDIPNLCNDEKLDPTSACRMCLVEIAGQERPLPSCNTPAAPGMAVQTKSDKLTRIRRTNVEMILSDHNAYCQPPCQVGCPTHIDIPGYLELIAKGQDREAARLVKEVLPFPFMLGLVCPAPCQEKCRRTLVDEEIAICRMHGFAAEQCLDDPPTPWPQEAPTGKKVAVIGAGPAGLTAAYYLALKGHAVKVFDMMPQAGGMTRYGIPEYRFQKDELDKELEGLWRLGVEYQGYVKLGVDFTVVDLFKAGYDAIFLGLGAWTSNPITFVDGSKASPEDTQGLINAITYLMDKTQGLPVPVDPETEVAVLGGGFTTFDCTRTSLRLGAKVHTAYRRGRKEMTATFEEVEDGESEGAELILFAAPTKIIQDASGTLTGLELIKMKQGEPDKSGRRRPVVDPGTEFVVPCNTVIPAFGQSPDVSYFPTHVQGVVTTDWQTVKTDPWNFMTDRAGVFAGGDCQMGAKTVIECVAQGKLAARSMDAYLKDSSPANMAAVSKRIETEERAPDLISIVPYKPVEPKVKMPMLPYEDRRRNFRLIELGYTPEQAQREAARCLQCACPAAGQCDLQMYGIELGLTDNRFHDGEPQDFHDYEVDVSHSFILRDPNKCINCTQCVRVCHDVIGPNCYGMFGKGFDTIVSTPFNVSLARDGLRVVRRVRAGLPDRLADDGRARIGEV